MGALVKSFEQLDYISYHSTDTGAPSIGIWRSVYSIVTTL